MQRFNIIRWLIVQSSKLKYSGINPETYDPPEGVNIVWNDNNTCTVYYSKDDDLEKVKKSLKC